MVICVSESLVTVILSPPVIVISSLDGPSVNLIAGLLSLPPVCTTVRSYPIPGRDVGLTHAGLVLSLSHFKMYPSPIDPGSAKNVVESTPF